MFNLQKVVVDLLKFSKVEPDRHGKAQLTVTDGRGQILVVQADVAWDYDEETQTPFYAVDFITPPRCLAGFLRDNAPRLTSLVLQGFHDEWDDPRNRDVVASYEESY